MTSSQIMKHLVFSGFAVAVLLLTACATTQMTASWSDPTYDRGPLKKVAIFAVYESATIRRLAEDQVVAQIPAGTEAVASYRLFETLEKGAREEIRKRLVDEGFDGALVMRLIDLSTQETYVPPYAYIIQNNPNYGDVPFYDSFDHYYGYVHGQVYTVPGFISSSTIARMETLLYTLPDNRLIWSAVSERVDPESADSVAHELALLITKELVGHGIVGRTRPDH